MLSAMRRRRMTPSPRPSSAGRWFAVLAATPYSVLTFHARKMLASGKMPQMNGEDNRQDAADRRGDRLTERWITLTRNGSSTHIFVGARGLVTKGASPLVGEPAEYLIAHVADGHGAVHPRGYIPFGHDAHPQYRTIHASTTPRRATEETERSLAEAVRTVMRAGDLSIALRPTGEIPAGRMAAIGAALDGLPALYRALWRASGFSIHVVGHGHTMLPDLIARQHQAGVPGVFEPRTERVYLLPAGVAQTDAYAVATMLEEVGHGCDVLIGRVLGLEGQGEGPLPSTAIYRSAQADFAALYQRYKATGANSSRMASSHITSGMLH